MAPWTFLRVNYVPMTLGIVFSTGLITTFIIAVLRGDVSPYLPVISETGGKFPEAGIFSIFLYLSATIGLSTMLVRYLIVDELNKNINRSIDILNRASVVIGFIAMMGMVVVAAFPMTSVGLAHGIGANLLFFNLVIYAVLQSIQSYKMHPHYNGLAICHIRLILSVLAAAALITGIALNPLASEAWDSQNHSHWTGNKVPTDKGFFLMLGGSIAEWSMALLFLAYYFSFIREFGKVVMHLELQLLVEHFDDELNSTIVSERTPIVL